MSSGAGDRFCEFPFTSTGNAPIAPLSARTVNPRLAAAVVRTLPHAAEHPPQREPLSLRLRRGHRCQRRRSRPVPPPNTAPSCSAGRERASGEQPAANTDGARARRNDRRRFFRLAPPCRAPNGRATPLQVRKLFTKQPCSTLPRNHARDIQDLESLGFALKNGRALRCSSHSRRQDTGSLQPMPGRSGQIGS